MGVSILTCITCDEHFLDYCRFHICTKCESVLCEECGLDAADEYGSGKPPTGKEDWYGDDDPDGCPHCDPEKVTSQEMEEYLWKTVGKSREELKQEILKERGVSE